MSALAWILLWVASGGASFVYWWTKYSDMTLDDFLVGGLIIGGFLGPFVFLGGLVIHHRNAVLLRKRGSK